MSATLLEEPKTLAKDRAAPWTDCETQKPGRQQLKNETQPGAFIVNLLAGMSLVSYLAYMLWWAITLGAIAVAGFFGWLTYLSLFTYFLWRDGHEERRTHPRAQ